MVCLCVCGDCARSGLTTVASHNDLNVLIFLWAEFCILYSFIDPKLCKLQSLGNFATYLRTEKHMTGYSSLFFMFVWMLIVSFLAIMSNKQENKNKKRTMKHGSINYCRDRYRNSLRDIRTPHISNNNPSAEKPYETKIHCLQYPTQLVVSSKL